MKCDYSPVFCQPVFQVDYLTLSIEATYFNYIQGFIENNLLPFTNDLDINSRTGINLHFPARNINCQCTVFIQLGEDTKACRRRRQLLHLFSEHLYLLSCLFQGWWKLFVMLE